MQYRIVDRLERDAGDERERVIAGLVANPARIEPKYFYDELGCALYGAICRLPEYYPTRTEAALFREHRSDIADAIGKARQFVDLGAGDCCKAQAWLPFVAPARYIAVDIAAAEIERALAAMAPDYPEVEMVGVVADFTRGLPLDGILDARPATFFYPGSSIGNFTPARPARSSRGSARNAPSAPAAAFSSAWTARRASPSWTPPTTTRWASRRPSTATRCST